MFSTFVSFYEDQRLNVTGNNISSEAIKVNWSPVTLDVKGYTVRYWAEKEGEVSAVYKNVSKTTNSLVIDKLRTFTVYVVQVTASIPGFVIRGQTRISTAEEGMLISLHSTYSTLQDLITNRVHLLYTLVVAFSRTCLILN